MQRISSMTRLASLPPSPFLPASPPPCLLTNPDREALSKIGGKADLLRRHARRIPHDHLPAKATGQWPRPTRAMPGHPRHPTTSHQLRSIFVARPTNKIIKMCKRVVGLVSSMTLSLSPCIPGVELQGAHGHTRCTISESGYFLLGRRTGRGRKVKLGWGAVQCGMCAQLPTMPLCQRTFLNENGCRQHSELDFILQSSLSIQKS